MSIISLFLLYILAARCLGDERFGVFSFALAFVSMFAIINDCGLRYVYVTKVSRERNLAELYLSNILPLQICLSALGFLLIFIVINLLSKRPESKIVIYLIAGAEILRFIKMLCRFVFRAYERFELETLTVCIERITLLAVGTAVLISGYGVIWFAWTFLAVRSSDLIVTFLVLQKTIFRPTFRFNFHLWLRLIKQGLPFALTGLTLLLLLRIDTVMISFIRNDAEVGWYNASYKLIEGILIFPAIFVNSLLPPMSRLYKDLNLVMSLYQRGVKYILLASIPLTILGFLLADKIIPFLFGEEYLKSIVILRILVWSLTFTFVYNIGGALLAAINKQKVTFYISCIVLFLNIAFNSILIPKMGCIGAAIATVMSAITFCLLISFHLFYQGYKLPYLELALKPLLATSIVAIILIIYPLPLGLAMFLSIIAYFFIITLLSFWDEEEILLIKQIAKLVGKYASSKP